MPDGTDTVETVGKVLSALSLTSAEKSYEFTKNASRREIICTCTQDWQYAYTSGGTYFPVPANWPFPIKLNRGDTQTLYFKRVSADGTLSMAVRK